MAISFRQGVVPLAFTLGSMAYIPQVSAHDFSGYVVGGVATTPEYEGSDKQQISPLVAGRVNYKNDYIDIMGTTLKANISPSPSVEFGPVLSYGGGRDDDVDSDAVSRLREIDEAVEAGAFVTIPFPDVFAPGDTLALNADVLADVSDTHDGFTVTMGVGYDREITSRLSLGVSVDTTFASEDYTQTYFGIDADNAARSGLARYDAGSGLKDAGLKVKAGYKFSAHWGLQGLVGYTRLLGDPADSPVVDREGSANQWRAGLGVAYFF